MAEKETIPTDNALAAPAPASMERYQPSTPEPYTGLSCVESGISCCVRAAFFPCFPCYLTKVNDFERVVRLRFGKLVDAKAGAGGLYVVWPIIDNILRVDVREQSINVPGQSILTVEGLTIAVDGVVFFKVVDAMKTVFGVEDYAYAVSNLAQTKLREVLGIRRFEELQSDRVKIEHDLKTALQGPTEPWGIHVTRVELTDLRLPEGIQRAMGQEAESVRNARAKVIEARGEEEASKTLKDAADIMKQNGAALQLRFLQTINEVATENSSTIILPFPTDFLNSQSLNASLQDGKE